MLSIRNSSNHSLKWLRTLSINKENPTKKATSGNSRKRGRRILSNELLSL